MAPNWSQVPRDAYERRHEEIISQDAWIVDGGGDLSSIHKRTERATDIILVDMPLYVHFWLAAERHTAWANGMIQHPPAGIRDVPPLRRLFEIIWEVDRDWLPVLRKLCDGEEAEGKRVTRVKSFDELQMLLSS